jgi:beta-glucanase (GH16 family)
MMTNHITFKNARTGISKTGFFVRAAGGCAVFVTLLFASEMRAANILTNSGFETANLASWTTFGGNNFSESGGNPHGGVNFYKVFGQFPNPGALNFTGIYQDNPSIPGATYSADGWTYSDSADSGGIHGQDAVWVEVSFRDGSKNALALYRSIVVNGANIAGFGGLDTWFDLQITNQCSFTNPSGLILPPGTVTNTVTSLVAPAGTAFVRYQVVFEQGPDNANGSMYFDDLTLNNGTVVTAPPPATTNWNIVWDDEFNGTSINTNIWSFETGNNDGWGNNELEYYTGRTNNAYVGDGLLHIVARRESTNTFSYTSARMNTLGTHNLPLYVTPIYGRFEWRARLPAGVGMWPALWMMGADFPSIGWPGCGEIDVVENNGANPTFVQGSLHAPNNFNPTSIFNFTDEDSVTNFHTYVLDWETNLTQWFVDGKLYETQISKAPFNAPFFFLMNLAVGGNYLSVNGVNPTIGQINAGTVFPQELQVDYVRIYEQTVPLEISVTQSNGSVILDWPTNIVCHLQTQTNSLASGSWSDVNNATNPFVVLPDPNNASVFYRLQSP